MLQGCEVGETLVKSSPWAAALRARRRKSRCFLCVPLASLSQPKPLEAEGKPQNLRLRGVYIRSPPPPPSDARGAGCSLRSACGTNSTSWSAPVSYTHLRAHETLMNL
eukprot:2763360-Prymnesium_polylepis.1